MTQNSPPDNVIYPANVSRLRKALKHIQMELFSHLLLSFPVLFNFKVS